MLADLGERFRGVRQGPDGWLYGLADGSKGRALWLERRAVSLRRAPGINALIRQPGAPNMRRSFVASGHYNKQARRSEAVATQGSAP